MAGEVQSEAMAPGSMGATRESRERRTHQILIWLLVVLAAGAVLALLMPVNFEKTYGVSDKQTWKLECGSVVFPREKVGAATYNFDCAVARTQRLGYAGLSLAGAVVVTAICLAKQVSRRKGSAEHVVGGVQVPASGAAESVTSA
ncbi:hypothetical protein ACWD4B_16695 [Streptomyces sp. NPDC002536]